MLADEHVDRAYVTVHHSNDDHVATAATDYPRGTADARLLKLAAEEGLVVLTNDRDFDELAEREDPR